MIFFTMNPNKIKYVFLRGGEGGGGGCGGMGRARVSDFFFQRIQI